MIDKFDNQKLLQWNGDIVMTSIFEAQNGVLNPSFIAFKNFTKLHLIILFVKMSFSWGSYKYKYIFIVTKN